MAKKIVAGNWKMNKNLAEAKALAEDLKSKLSSYDTSGVQLIVSPNFMVLSSVKEILDGSGVHTSSQNIHQEESGAFTGEVSGEMLASANVEYAIVGHSERREYYNENSEVVAKKVKKAIEKGITPIYCCGEVKEDRESGKQFDVVEQQISSELFDLSESDFAKVVIAYEPVWAIGTGLTASPEQAQEIHAFIRSKVSAKYGEAIANDTSILYGGSCKPGNAKEIFANPDVDGGLIGGASLKADDFLQIAASF